jgi:hypothetical protein
MQDHLRPPDNCHLRILFSPMGATFFDDRNLGALGKAVVVMIKHGRLTISGDGNCNAEPFVFLRNRHIQQMRLITSGAIRLRIELSDMSVDLFEGLSVAELEWVRGVVDSELRKHRRRKEMAMAQDPLPDRWRYPVLLHRSWQDSLGFLLLAGLLLCLMAAMFCLREVSSASGAIDGTPLDSELVRPFIEWLAATVATILLGVLMISCLFRWHAPGEPKRSASD